MTTNNILAMTALSAAFKRPDSDLPSGSHKVSITVRIEGYLKVGNESTRAPTPPWKQLALLAMAKLEEHQRHDVVAKGFAKPDLSGAVFKDAESVVQQRLADLPKSRIRGRASFAGEVGII
jgi:hypothetical protein